jgi:predicted unusual protein kinase regulating ubiquinone biosynthesis (AarF/ABC1/UbiB family)
MRRLMDEERKIPKGRISRLARFASAGARTGLTLLRKGGDANDSARKTAAILGQMRGVATKLGQMASYVDGVVPPEHREAYEKQMAKLQASTPRSAPAQIRLAIERDLGAPLDTLFSEWSDAPIASASIGQVHRAVLMDGRTVAVKVQHPGIRAALEADLKNAGILEMALSTVGMGKFDSKRLLAETREKFLEELDYALEARRQIRFAAIHAGDPTIQIPAVIEGLSGGTVLTTEFVSGQSFNEACAASETQRRAWAQTLWRFVYKGNLVGGMFNADPHPGNYLFGPDGRIAFLDFGCVQPLTEAKRLSAVSMHQAAACHDWDLFFEGAKDMLGSRGGLYEELVKTYLRDCFRPVSDSPFRITREYSAGLVEQFKAMTNELRKSKNDDFVPLPPGILFINRLQFGFFSVLARLDAEVDYCAVERQFLAEAGLE